MKLSLLKQPQSINQQKKNACTHEKRENFNEKGKGIINLVSTNLHI